MSNGISQERKKDLCPTNHLAHTDGPVDDDDGADGKHKGGAHGAWLAKEMKKKGKQKRKGKKKRSGPMLWRVKLVVTGTEEALQARRVLGLTMGQTIRGRWEQI